MRSSNQAIRIWTALLIASLLVALPLSSPAVAATRQVRARAAYERAARMRTTLDSKPESARKKADYEDLIRAFKSVHYYDPAYGKSPLALEAVGDLFAEMGRRFDDDAYYRAAIQAYRYLIAEYPQSTFSRDAIYTVAEIYRSDLQDNEEARKAFQEFVKKYPRAAQAPEAREKLKQIDRGLVTTKPQASASNPDRPGTPGLATVTAIRRWVGPNYSRIVVMVEGEVKFESSRVPDPDRIVLDLLDSRLSSTLVGRTFPGEDGFLRQVRVGQFQPSVTRVVLDVEKIEDYSVFTLPNPFRLVIDINGPTPVEMAKTAELKSPETKGAKKAEEPPAPQEVAKPDARKAPPPPAPARRRGDEQTTASELPKEEKAKPGAEIAKAPEQPEKKESARLSPGPNKGELPAGAPSESLKSIKTSAPTESGSRTLTRALGLKIARIVIDPGHGGHDTGTLGPTGLAEKDVVLDVGLRLRRLLEAKTGAEVVMTRSDDTFIPLEERTAIANEKGADLFISVHANASRDRRARGIETYFLNFTSDPEALEVAARENATTQESVHELQNLVKKIALNEKIEESQDFAGQIQREVFKQLRKATGKQKDRGVKKAPFVVLIGANMPSVLAEISFLTNPQDERLLKKSGHRQQIAEALHRGISQYVNSLGGVKVAQQTGTTATAAPRRESAASSASNF